MWSPKDMLFCAHVDAEPGGIHGNTTFAVWAASRANACVSKNTRESIRPKCHFTLTTTRTTSKPKQSKSFQ